MDALNHILGDGKGLVGVALILAATLLCALGQLTGSDWQSFSVWVFGIYAGSTAVHQSAVAFAGKSAPATLAVPAAPSAPQ